MQNDIVRQPPSPQNKPVPPQVQPTPVQAAPQSPTTTPQQLPNPVPAALGTNSQDAKSQSPGNKSDKPVAAIITAIVLCLALVGAAVYLGLSSKEASDTSSKQPASQNQQAQDAAAPTSDIDSAVSETDGLQQEVPDLEPELADQSLGL